MPNKPIPRKPSETRKFSKTLFKPKPKIVLNEKTNNRHIKAINMQFTNAKTTSSKIAKLQFSASFFARKRKGLEKLLTEIVNQTPPEKIFRELEDFDIAEFKAVGAKEYSRNLTEEIENLKTAFNYTETLLRKINPKK
jgi:hypothetical protein